jgi:hypothetical protein
MRPEDLLLGLKTYYYKPLRPITMRPSDLLPKGLETYCIHILAHKYINIYMQYIHTTMRL